MKRIFVFGVVALSLTLAACGPSDEEMLAQIELASMKTQQAWTPMPTQTAYPTSAPLPTYTSLPIQTPRPTVDVEATVEAAVELTVTAAYCDRASFLDWADSLIPLNAGLRQDMEIISQDIGNFSATVEIAVRAEERIESLGELYAPPCLLALHDRMVSANRALSDSMIDILAGDLEAALLKLEIANTHITDANKLLDSLDITD